MYSKLFSKCTGHIIPGKYFIEKLSTVYYYRGYSLFIFQVLCQNGKRPIDGSLLNVLHLKGPENPFNSKAGYCR